MLVTRRGGVRRGRKGARETRVIDQGLLVVTTEAPGTNPIVGRVAFIGIANAMDS